MTLQWQGYFRPAYLLNYGLLLTVKTFYSDLSADANNNNPSLLSKASLKGFQVKADFQHKRHSKDSHLFWIVLGV